MSKLKDKLIEQREFLDGLVTLMNDIKTSTDVQTVVCGGAIRDALNFRPVRDIDLYVHQQYYTKVYRFLTGRDPDEDDMNDWNPDNPAYVHQTIMYQEEIQLDRARLRPLPASLPDIINIVGIQDAKPYRGRSNAGFIFHITGKYNFGICMVGMGNDGVIHKDSRYIQDVSDQTITLYRSEWGRDASMRQFEKLNKKYEGWPLIEYKEPGHYDDVAAQQGLDKVL